MLPGILDGSARTEHRGGLPSRLFLVSKPSPGWALCISFLELPGRLPIKCFCCLQPNPQMVTPRCGLYSIMAAGKVA